MLEAEELCYEGSSDLPNDVMLVNRLSDLPMRYYIESYYRDFFGKVGFLLWLPKSDSVYVVKTTDVTETIVADDFERWDKMFFSVDYACCKLYDFEEMTRVYSLVNKKCNQEFFNHNFMIINNK